MEIVEDDSVADACYNLVMRGLEHVLSSSSRILHRLHNSRVNLYYQACRYPFYGFASECRVL